MQPPAISLLPPPAVASSMVNYAPAKKSGGILFFHRLPDSRLALEMIHTARLVPRTICRITVLLPIAPHLLCGERPPITWKGVDFSIDVTAYSHSSAIEPGHIVALVSLEIQNANGVGPCFLSADESMYLAATLQQTDCSLFQKLETLFYGAATGPTLIVPLGGSTYKAICSLPEMKPKQLSSFMPPANGYQMQALCRECSPPIHLSAPEALSLSATELVELVRDAEAFL
ncbi:hypothetical protein PAPYR_3236 [Paratrimastix pyriformis]|uniref:Uncharacterized protein n=1 Tax=Paratrimastix pyriformis TaxID=342808 RepID=A0ABQ8UST7_9EUKA|nr:hypothetical protein PAPYR_3236 [Paratrimastix pyriformis]